MIFVDLNVFFWIFVFHFMHFSISMLFKKSRSDLYAAYFLFSCSMFCSSDNRVGWLLLDSYTLYTISLNSQVMYIRKIQILVQAPICTWLIIYAKKGLWKKNSPPKKERPRVYNELKVFLSVIINLQWKLIKSILTQNRQFCQC